MQEYKLLHGTVLQQLKRQSGICADDTTTSDVTFYYLLLTLELQTNRVSVTATWRSPRAALRHCTMMGAW